MSRNLIKASQFVLKEKEPIVVNNNELLAKKIEILNPDLLENTSEGFKSGLNAPEVNPLFVDVDLPENEDGANIEAVEEEKVDMGPSAEELIAQAEAEIEEMRQKAQEDIARWKEQSIEEGKQQGYEEGRQTAKQEFENAKLELEQKSAALEQEYQKLIDELEPKFIQTITGIYEEIFKVDLAEYKSMLSYAIANTIRHIEGTKDFLVHISREDYERVAGNKEELMEKLPSGQISVELIEDSTLGKNECMIETSNGIFDCGIGTQLEELTRKLRLLSYEG